MPVKQSTIDRKERRQRELVCEFIGEKEEMDKAVVRRNLAEARDLPKKTHRYVDILEEKGLTYLEATYDEMIRYVDKKHVNILCIARHLAAADSHADTVMNGTRIVYPEIPIVKCSPYMEEFLKFDCGEPAEESNSRYPFSKLEFGQSFWQRFDEGIENSLRSYVSQWNKRGRKQFKFLKLGKFETFEVGRIE